MDVAALAASATARLDPAAADYINRGAGADVTRDDNVAAWQRRRVRPHVLRDVSGVDPATTVLGTPVTDPVLVAPTAMQQLASAEAECATARGAARAGTVMVVSMVASRSVEDVAAAAPGAPRWCQLYLLRDRGRTRALAERARDAGYGAIVLSVDGAGVPFGDHRGATPTAPGLGYPNLARPGDDPDLLGALAEFDPSVTPDDVAHLAEWTGLPVVVKGLVRGDDARAAVDAGAAAVVVSNHGGRLVDGVIATADALPEVVDAVAGDAEVLVDGGVRSGTDVLRALALGARAVLVGRPAVWALATGGEDGVADVLAAFRQDLMRVLAFCGVATVGAVTPDLLVGAP